MRILLATLLTLALSFLAHAETVRLSEPVESSSAWEVFGAPMDDKQPGMSLQSVIDQEEDMEGEGCICHSSCATGCSQEKLDHQASVDLMDADPEDGRRWECAAGRNLPTHESFLGYSPLSSARCG